MSRRFSTRTRGTITLAVSASYLELEVTTDPYATEATAEVTGPDEVLDKIREETRGDTWSLAFPRTPGGHQGGTIIQSSGSMMISGGVSMSGGNVYIGGGRGRGRVIVNGVDVTDMVNANTPEPLRAVVTLPAGSSLDVRIESGDIAVRGAISQLSADTTSADIRAEAAGSLRARSISGDVSCDGVSGPSNVHTVSGDVDLTAGGNVNAETTSGDIHVHATESVAVDAGSVSGDIRVTADRGVRPDVRGRSVSGRVRT